MNLDHYCNEIQRLTRSSMFNLMACKRKTRFHSKIIDNEKIF